MNIKIPELTLVLIIGVSSSGKSTFAKRHFLGTEVISSDYCRGLVSDSENDMEATNDAFDLLRFIAEKRLKAGKLTVIDATNIQPEARKPLIELARRYHFFVAAIVLDIPESIIKERHVNRSDRDFGNHVLIKQKNDLKKSLKSLKREGVKFTFFLKSIDDVENAKLEREVLYNNKRNESGPFDIIGDVHGCFDELKELMEKMDYNIEVLDDKSDSYGYKVTHPEGRKLIFLGDLVDRGEKIAETLKIVMSMSKSGIAYCVPGNHDIKLLKKLSGDKVTVKHGLEKTVEQLSGENELFISELREFLHSMISHYVFDNGRLVVSHAGLKEEMQGRGSGRVRDFCLYGETTGETDEYGLPERYEWAKEYNGKARVIYGHTPVIETEWLNNTLNIDTGCVFGGSLTAFRYPENQIVAVEAKKVYYEPVRPIKNSVQILSAQQEYDDMLNIDDVIGKHIIETRFNKHITIKEENSISALEVMSRFAVNPKWLIYLPPTMSPSETSEEEGYLEHPAQALEYFKENGIEKVICEEKHMGSRTVIIVCKNEEVSTTRFGITEKTLGICFTRTGRRFFNNYEVEKLFLEKLNTALSKSLFWDKHETDWVCLDCELMPWSAKAQDLIKNQYAAVGCAGKNSLKNAISVIEKAKERGLEIDAIGKNYKDKYDFIVDFENAYSQYCRETDGINGIKLAPFHILATEGNVHYNKSHEWHMENIALFCEEDKELLIKTPYKIVEFNNEESVKEAILWWEELTSKGGEGMVVKPMEFYSKGAKGVVQPAIKCRGREYLRIIYGFDYSTEKNLKTLRKRGLSKKRSMAMSEFILGLEALSRFVEKQPLRKIHECVFGVLAMESEEVDPRL